MIGVEIGCAIESGIKIGIRSRFRNGIGSDGMRTKIRIRILIEYELEFQ